MTFARQTAQPPAPRNLAEIDLAPRAASLRAEVLEGLSRAHKSLPPKLFYDARGAMLFTRICGTRAYYPTRTETSILRRCAGEIAGQIGREATLVEPGAGDMRKIRILLPALRPAAYMPVDISLQQLREEARQLALEFPWLAITAVCADFHAPGLDALVAAQAGRRVLFFPGSTIGNFEPGPAQDFLRRAHDLLGAGGAVLLGVDLRKPKAILDLAYNDPEGYTAQFNLNLLLRLNRELGAQFDLSAFAHRAFYNEAASRIEMHLVSRRAQSVRVAGQLVQFAADETIHTENSYKYTSEQVQQMARAAGFDGVRAWTDPLGWFGVFLLSGAERAGNAR
jgi:L-histidine N-alpha-methyltransferase